MTRGRRPKRGSDFENKQKQKRKLERQIVYNFRTLRFLLFTFTDTAFFEIRTAAGFIYFLFGLFFKPTAPPSVTTIFPPLRQPVPGNPFDKSRLVYLQRAVIVNTRMINYYHSRQFPENPTPKFKKKKKK